MNWSRKILLFCCMVSFTTNYLSGQNSYAPINFENGRWVYAQNFKKGPFWGTEYETDTLLYFFKGDTVILNHLYRKLYFTGNSYSYGKHKSISGYAGAFRDDTLNQTVWYGNEIANDYNLLPGDTVKQGLGVGDIIDQIDSVLYCGKYFPRFLFKNTSVNSGQIQNISALNFCFRYFFMAPPRFLCYYEANNSSCNSCAGPLKANSVNALNFSIYPNPTGGNFHVRSKEKVKSIAVYNALGTLVLEKNETRNQFTLDLSGFPQGIYMVTIMTQKGAYSEKIVKN